MVWHLNITLHVINIGCGNWCILQQKKIATLTQQYPTNRSWKY